MSVRCDSVQFRNWEPRTFSLAAKVHGRGTISQSRYNATAAAGFQLEICDNGNSKPSTEDSESSRDFVTTRRDNGQSELVWSAHGIHSAEASERGRQPYIKNLDFFGFSRE